MSATDSFFGFIGTLLKRAFMAIFLLGGLLLGLLIAIKVALVIFIMRTWCAFRTSPTTSSSRGQTLEGEYTVINPQPRSDTMINVDSAKQNPPEQKI